MRGTKELGLDGASLLVWTTTPWTLPSNQFAAVHPELEYSVVVDHNDTTGTTEKLIVASALVETIAGKVKRELKVEKKILGGSWLGCGMCRRLIFIIECLASERGQLKNGGEEHIAWRVVSCRFCND